MRYSTRSAIRRKRSEPTEVPEAIDHAPERAVLVGVHLSGTTRWATEDHLGELRQLVASADVETVGQEIVRRGRPIAATFIGSGKVEGIKLLCEVEHANVVIFDEDLSPAQQRNLEEALDRKVIDRTALILDIFAQRAHTKEAQLQIELAQLRYLYPRLTRRWTHLSKQYGGVGTRGPGEQQLEVDRRRVRGRITKLSAAIRDVRRRRQTQRKSRQRAEFKAAVFVGYTNAGKSTLLNALTSAGVLVEDKLFATVDPTTKRLLVPNHRKVLLTDTVGFIRKLPHHLVESFYATLEEVCEADCLVHVLDASHPQAEEQSEAVYSVLAELGADDKPVVTALNKIDLISSEAVADRLARSHPRPVVVSALRRRGLDALLAEIADVFASDLTVLRLRVPQREARLVASLCEDGHIVRRRYLDNAVLIDVELPSRLVPSVRRYVVG